MISELMALYTLNQLCAVLFLGHQHNEVLFCATRSHASFQVCSKLPRRLPNLTCVFFCNVIGLVRGGGGEGDPRVAKAL